MRLIDADALRDSIVERLGPYYARHYVGPVIDAAPTIPTTETNNGVTSCRFCGGVVDVEYPAGSPKATPGSTIVMSFRYPEEG